MHERKALMVELADGFIALTGGYDPLLELFASYKPVSVPKWITPAQA